MELQDLARQMGQSPEQLQRLAQSPDGQRLAQLLERSAPGITSGNDAQAAAQALKQLLAQPEGRALLQRLSRQLQK